MNLNLSKSIGSSSHHSSMTYSSSPMPSGSCCSSFKWRNLDSRKSIPTKFNPPKEGEGHGRSKIRTFWILMPMNVVPRSTSEKQIGQLTQEMWTRSYYTLTIESQTTLQNLSTTRRISAITMLTPNNLSRKRRMREAPLKQAGKLNSKTLSGLALRRETAQRPVKGVFSLRLTILSSNISWRWLRNKKSRWLWVHKVNQSIKRIKFIRWRLADLLTFQIGTFIDEIVL